MAAARTAGKRVEDLSQRTEYSKVYANPDGTWTEEDATTPEQVQDGQGQWHDIDLNLVPVDGGLAPAYAATDLVVSDGGGAALASMTAHGTRLDWRWPGNLPAPVVDGNTATYPGAVPGGGDLVVTATATGFRYDVVLHQAPATPLSLTVPVATHGAHVGKNKAGGLDITTAAGDTVASAPRPVMWDSSGDPDAATPADDPAVAPVATTIGQTDTGTPTLTLSPDQGFLTDPSTVYPVTVDPTFTAVENADTWTATPDNTEGHPTDAELRAGTSDAGAHKARSFLWFGSAANNAGWAGKDILSANLVMRNFVAGSCTGAAVVARRITETWNSNNLTWATAPAGTTEGQGSYTPAHGAGASCPAADAVFPVTSIVQDWADNTYPNLGLLVRANDETNSNSWRKYRSGDYSDTNLHPKLVVNYNTAPTTPTGLAIAPCLDGCTTKVAGSLTPRLSAKANDDDPGDKLTYTFQIAPAGSTTASVTSPGVGPLDPNTTATWQVPASSKLADNTSYQFRVGANDGHTTTWSGWLGFVAHNSAPTKPSGLAISPCPDGCSSWVTDSLTPTLSATANDADLGDILTYTFQVAPAGSTTPIVSSPGVGPLAPNTTASWQVPADKLADNASYQFRVGAKDGYTTTWSDWLGFSTGADRPPAVPDQLAVSPCAGDCSDLVAASLNPDLTAVVTDEDSDTIDAQFEVRTADGEATVLATGSDTVSSGETARFTVPVDTLTDGGSYEFRVTAKDATSATASAWTPFTVHVDPNAPGTLQLHEPTVIWDQGPELSWSSYKDPSSAEGDDLVEYQIYRGCVSSPLPDGCSTTTGPDYGPTTPGIELVGTVDADQTSWTDSTAIPSSASTASTYYYWVAARTQDDIGPGTDDQHRPDTASQAQKVTTPRQGRVVRVFTPADATGDSTDGAPGGSETFGDTTISKAKPDTVVDPPVDAAGASGDWLQVGNNHPTNGVERALMAFDTQAIKTGLIVTAARLELHQVGGGGTGATFEVHNLTRSFTPKQATWNNATSTVKWTTPGGDMDAQPLATLTTDNTAKTLTLGGGSGDGAGGLTSAVQGWVNDPATNHGLALRTSVDTAQQWLNLASSEASDPSMRPRLVVESLKTDPSAAITATQVPERFLPQTVTHIPVTVTNTTLDTWPADMRLSYRWANIGETMDQDSTSADKTVPLGRSLAPGESVKVELTLRAPINSATGSKLKDYDLFLDLQSGGAWWSLTHPWSDATLTQEQREERQCTLTKDGLLCPERVVDVDGSSQVGLEKYLTYTGEPTGGGGSLLTNLSTGNVVWSYDPIANPSVGPSMFTRVTYNSKDVLDPGTGADWSVQVATLSRIGSLLNATGNDKSVTIIDGDGTTHEWLQDEASTTAAQEVYLRPAGVQLELTGTPTGSPGYDPDKRWVFTRPDGTKFFYDNNGRPSSILDANNNTLTFKYDDTSLINRLTRVIDAKGRVVAQLTWDNAGLVSIRDISGRALKFSYNSAHQLVGLEDGGGYDPASGTFAAEVKRFTFGYTTSQPNSALLNMVTDPRRVAGDPAQDQATYLDYYTSTDSYPDGAGTMPGLAVGRPKSITDRMDRTTDLLYYDGDANDGVNIRAKVTATDPQDPTADETTTYDIDGYGRTIAITDPNANAAGTNLETTLGWDADHNLVRLEDANGAVSRWLYDANTGYPLKVWDPQAVRDGGNPEILSYGHAGSTGPASQITVLTSVTTPSGKKTTFGHDANGNLTSVTDPLGNTTTYTYNGDGTQASATDANQHVTTYSYAGNGALVGYPTTITPPAGIAATHFAYDDRGNVTSTTQTGTDATLTTTAVYDAFGRPTSITTPGAQGRPRTTTTTYDLNDNVTRQVAPNGAVTTATYLPDDQVASSTLPPNTTDATSGGDSTADRVVSYTYDAMGRLATQTSPLGNQTSKANDHLTRYSYDHDGNVTRLEQPLAGPNGETAVTTYDYDNVGNLIKVVDPRKNAGAAGAYAARMVYDDDGRQTAVIDAAGYATRTRYDADGNVTATIDQRGAVTTYGYDDDGRQTSKTITHTPTGQATEHWTTGYEYDHVGNLVTLIRPHKTSTAATLYEDSVYDANNQLTARKSAFDPNAADARYRDPAITYFTYDDLGRLQKQSAPTKATDPAAADVDWTEFTHYPSGDIKTSTDPWGVQTNYEYNRLGEQTQRILSNAAGGQTRAMSWAYNPDGSLASRDDDASPAAAIQVDNTDTTTSSGDWDTTTPSVDDPGSGSAVIGTDYRTHPPAAAGTPAADDRFTWQVTPAQTGRYRLEISCQEIANATGDAAYTIDTGTGGSEVAHFDQRRCTDDHTWHRLGAYQLTGGQTAAVALAPSSDGVVAADAVRLVALDNERTFAYTYDADGNQTSVEDQTPDVRVDHYTTSYDDVGRVNKVQEMAGATVMRSTDYTYDLNGNTTSTLAQRFADAGPDGTGRGDVGSVASSRYTAYEWDIRDLVAKVTAGKTADDTALKQWGYTYDPRGMRATVTKPGPDGTATGDVTTFAYHESGLLRSTVERTPTGTLVASHRLWFNPDGDRTRDVSRVQDADNNSAYLDQTADYTYTPARQLASVTKSGANKSTNESYTYDPAGNVDTQTIGPVETDYTYDRDRLVSSHTAGDAGDAEYNYDGLGRLTSVTADNTGDSLVSYLYDGFDRLTQETHTPGNGNPSTTTTAYDPFDRATVKTTTIGTGAPKKTRFDYLGLTEQVAVEEQQNTTGDWKAVKSYTYGPDGSPLALANTPVDGSTGKTEYYSTNPHGDVEALTNPANGKTDATYRYTAYGTTDKTGTTGADKATIDPANPVDDSEVLNPYRFNSKRIDPATGAYDMGFRNYDPGLNRFLSRDMYNGALDDLNLGTDPWHTNRYAYAGGNPITGIELDGHISVDPNGAPAPYQPTTNQPWSRAVDSFHENHDAFVDEHTGDLDCSDASNGSRCANAGAYLDLLHQTAEVPQSQQTELQQAMLAEWNYFLGHEGVYEDQATTFVIDTIVTLPLGGVGGLLRGEAARVLTAESTSTLAAKGRDDLVDVWRTVGADEAADIAKTGGYRVPAGGEGKYFFPTREQAENLGRMYSKKSWAGPQTLTRGQVPRSIIERSETLEPAGEGLAWFIRSGDVPSICNVVCIGPIG